MDNPLLNVPLNTKRVYVMAKTIDCCEVYMPVDSHDGEEIETSKKKLQDYLDKQDVPFPPDSAA